MCLKWKILKKQQCTRWRERERERVREKDREVKIERNIYKRKKNELGKKHIS